jgi:hypothetical protein
MFESIPSCQQLAERIRSALLPKKLPVQAHIVEHFPRNANNKLDRKALLAEYLSVLKELHCVE